MSTLTDLDMPTVTEGAEIKRFVKSLPGSYELRLVLTPGSPWLIFHARLWSWSGPVGSEPPRDRTFGMWRRSLAIYAEGPDGAMGDDPVQELSTDAV